MKPKAVHFGGQGFLVLPGDVVYLLFNGVQQCRRFCSGCSRAGSGGRDRRCLCFFPLPGISRFLFPLAEDAPETLFLLFTGLNSRCFFLTGNVLFADFMEQWLTVIKSSVAVTTFASYSNMVKKVIVPYFRERQIALQELSAKHIQDFYLKELERVSASSVIHYHANIHKALKYAVKLDLISSNPADKIERPKKERFMANFYDADEVNRLFEISKGTKLEIPILFGAFYGMRRSETLGMKWDAIDFERDTITIRHTLTTVALDGKRITVAEDRTKNKSSMRTLPPVPFVKERLLELKAEQEENRRLCGRSYVKDYTGYVCINEIGDIIKPNYVSCGFPKLLEEHGLRRVRYHDLRHSCASLLLANGVPMKQIQEWLGHSDFGATANIYAHLEYSSKVISADAMLAGLGIGNRE